MKLEKEFAAIERSVSMEIKADIAAEALRGEDPPPKATGRSCCQTCRSNINVSMYRVVDRNEYFCRNCVR